MDVTEAKLAQAALGRAQAELAHANRVASLGEMSASIAHEVNQPLGAISINGEVLQHSNTTHLIFNIPTLIAHLSSVMTLEVGDIISTGTPAGVGLGRTPPRWLVPGDEMVVEVEGLGALRNKCVAEA